MFRINKPSVYKSRINKSEIYKSRIKKPSIFDDRYADRSLYTPVIRASICTGERALGFVGVEDKVFHEVCVVNSEKDIQIFKETYHVDELDVIY
jgi:hypothetical protein